MALEKSSVFLAEATEPGHLSCNQAQRSWVLPAESSASSLFCGFPSAAPLRARARTLQEPSKKMLANLLIFSSFVHIRINAGEGNIPRRGPSTNGYQRISTECIGIQGRNETRIHSSGRFGSIVTNLLRLGVRQAHIHTVTLCKPVGAISRIRKSAKIAIFVTNSLCTPIDGRW